MASEKSVRRCAACGAEEEPSAMVRWVRGPDGEVWVDLRAKAPGRGAWVHVRSGCLGRIQAALSKSFRAPVHISPVQAGEQLRAAAGPRVDQLLLTLRKRNLAAVGTTPAEAAFRGGRGSWLLLARDAQAAAKEAFVQEAVRMGRATAWADKATLGNIFGRSEVAVLAILEDRLAKDIFGAIAMALFTPTTVPRGKMEHLPSVGSATEVE